MQITKRSRPEWRGMKPLLGLTLLGAAISVRAAHATEYQVGPGLAYTTIQAAANAAQAGDTVTIHSGTYHEEVTLPKSGTAGAPITFRGATGEAMPTVTGTDRITTWASQGRGVYKATLPAFGEASNFGKEYQLFADGVMLQPTRWPRFSGTLVRPTGMATVDSATHVSTDGSGQTVWITDADLSTSNIARWKGAAIWVNTSRIHGGNIDGNGTTGTVLDVDAATNRIQVKFPLGGTAPGPYSATDAGSWWLGPGTEYFLMKPSATGVTNTGGITSVLSPGEYWINGTDVYVRISGDADPGTKDLECKDRLFAFRSTDYYTNRSYITLKGLKIFAATIITDNQYADRGSTSPAPTDTTNWVLDGLTVDYVSYYTDLTRGNTGANTNLWGPQDFSHGLIISGQNHTVKNCTLRYSSGSEITLRGSGHLITGNEMSHYGWLIPDQGAISAPFGTNFEISYNRIHDSPTGGIWFPRNQNADPAQPGIYRVHHNTLNDICLDINDNGAIVSGFVDHQWMRIDHNLIFNLPKAKAGGGIYFDGGGGPANGSGKRLIIDHNVVYKVITPIMINDYGQSLIANNVLLATTDTDNAIQNGNGPAGSNGATDVIRNNIMNRGPNLTGWGGSFPTLAGATRDHNIENATGNVLTNLFVAPNNGTLASRNYHLKAGSPAINGGVQIATTDAGGLNINETTATPDEGAYEFGAATESGVGAGSVAGSGTRLKASISPRTR